MKALAMAASAVALIATPALAETVSTPSSAAVTIKSNVTPKCEVSNLAALNGTVLTIDENQILNDGRFSPAAAGAAEQFINSTLDGTQIWCNNRTSAVHVTATPFASDYSGAPVAGFTDRVDYSLTMSVGGNNVSVSTVGTPKATGGADYQYNSAPFAGGLDASLDVQETQDRLIAGAYQAKITVSINPNA